MVSWERWKGEGCRISRKLNLFIYDVNKGNKGEGCVQVLLRDCRDEKTLLRSSASCQKRLICALFLSFIIGVVKANEHNLLKEFGVHLELADDWARHLLKSM